MSQHVPKPFRLDIEKLKALKKQKPSRVVCVVREKKMDHLQWAGLDLVFEEDSVDIENTDNLFRECEAIVFNFKGSQIC